VISYQAWFICDWQSVWAKVSTQHRCARVWWIRWPSLRQLSAITDPDLLVLFEDWFEELEQEVLDLFKSQGPLDQIQLAEKLGLSMRGATFLISKLRREGKL
jgi:hypothetical protein